VKKFKRIFIEISNMCNLACSFCPPSLRQVQALSTSQFEHIMQKLQGHGEHIYLHVKGEPLLHKDFEEILTLCSKYEKKVNITTNGLLLDQKGHIILKNPSVRLVNLSLQSYEENKGPDHHKAYLDKILNFVKKGMETTDILFEFRLWNFDEDTNTTQETEDNQKILDYVENFLGVNIPVTSQNTKGNTGHSQVYISKGTEFQWPSLTNDFVSTSGTCYGLRRQIAILSNGDVVPCCLDSEGVIKLGNIFESDFESIVMSEHSKRIRTGFENNKIIEDLCQRCGYRKQYVTR